MMWFNWLRDPTGEIILPGDLVAYNYSGTVALGRVVKFGRKDVRWSRGRLSSRRQVRIYIDRIDRSGKVLSRSIVTNPHNCLVIG